ncbi:SpoIIE family protein phosphatase [Nonomuraea sp. NPDC050310]|uniref:SpoIIE family protein phosphatase n=1 Tax=unclassified Nonomuraea TaxID=2593643 RepID=UPI0033D01E31
MDGVETVTLADRIAGLRATYRWDPGQADRLLQAALLELDRAQRELAGCEARIGAAAVEGRRHRQSLCGLLDRMPVPLFLLDLQGRITRLNQAAGRAFGPRLPAVHGKPFVAVVDLAHRPAFRSHLHAACHGGAELSLSTHLCLTGEAVAAELTMTRLPGEDLVAVTVLPSGGGVPPAPPPSCDVRIEVISELAGALLAEREPSEGWLLRRAAEVLTASYADLAVIDRRYRDGSRTRAAVAGDPGELDSIGLLERLAPLEDDGPALLNPIHDELALGRDQSGLPALTLLRAGSVIITPIGDDIDGFGTLTLIRRSDRPGFDHEDLRLCERAGRHLALALRADRTRRGRATSAHALQASLLPRRLPEVPGCGLSSLYSPAGEGELVGGDFYDVFPCLGGWGLVLGDVCGKGEEAAAITAVARHGLRVLAGRIDDPAVLLGEINHALLVHPDTDRFVTAVLALLSPSCGGLRIRLASAGHPPALIRGADGVVRPADGGGLPLGLFDDAGYPVQEIKLRYGEALVLYSDGVTEARDEQGRLYGPQRLGTAVAAAPGESADDIIRAVHEDLRRFAAPGHADDTALLVLRAHDEPEF